MTPELVQNVSRNRRFHNYMFNVILGVVLDQFVRDPPPGAFPERRGPLSWTLCALPLVGGFFNSIISVDDSEEGSQDEPKSNQGI